MQTFLDKAAKYLIDHHSDHIEDVCVVFPNRRASLFFKQSLIKQAGKTIWSPYIYSIEDFIIEHSGLGLIDPVFLQFELYKIHQQVEGKNAQEFIEFLNWGRILVQDFNDVDLYLVDPENLFGYLTSTKALSVWNLDNQPLTELQTKYLTFYNSLYTYYDELKKKLLDDRLVYQGLAYRYLAENFEQYDHLIKWKKLIFAGFNAFSPAEEKIIEYLKEKDLVEFLWDIDEYYIKDEQQEAGAFFRKRLSDDIQWIEGNFKNPKDINIIGVPKNVGQVKVAGQIARNYFHEQKSLRNTAIILNDESLVIPLLNSLPDEVKEFNLTMGLPLTDTSLYSWIFSMISMNENAVKLGRQAKEGYKIYHKDIKRILDHSYSKLLIYDDDYMSIHKLEELISHQIFIEPAVVRSKRNNALLDLLFEPIHDDAKEISSKIYRLLVLLKDRLTLLKSNEENLKDFDLDLEYLYHFSKTLQQLDKYLSQFSYLTSIKIYKELFNQLMQSATIPFYGEPLKGLQIMGMLESRTLDFENIIMLSVNEGFLPTGKSANSFIPLDFKFDPTFNLPTYKDKNAVFAYHFYRILQRAKNITLLYNTEVDELGGGDKSRFISQIQHELPRYNPEVVIKEQMLVVTPLEKKQIDVIRVEKNQEIIKKAVELVNKGLSASALNVYRNCSLQFYFKYILGISEAEEVEETIEANTLGSVIHDVLKDLYKPFLNQNIHEDHKSAMKSRVNLLVKEAFQIIYKGGDVDSGKNLLIVEVAKLFINNFIDKDFGWVKEANNAGLQMVVRDVEKELVSSLTIPLLGKELEVRLKGFVDRIDSLGEQYRIIDYKTGKVIFNDLKIGDFTDLKNNSKHDKLFQLLFYAYLFYSNTGTSPELIVPGIFSFRNLSSGLLSTEIEKEKHLSTNMLEQFESLLKEIISEIFDSKISFEQTETEENCKYCPFKTVCNRR